MDRAGNHAPGPLVPFYCCLGAAAPEASDGWPTLSGSNVDFLRKLPWPVAKHDVLRAAARHHASPGRSLADGVNALRPYRLRSPTPLRSC